MAVSHTAVAGAAGTSVPAEVYLAVQRFYAHQMFLLDEGRVEEWTDTFTEDGVYRSNSLPAPVRGRRTICAETLVNYEKRVSAGVVHRHVVTMLSVTPGPDAGTYLARSYVLVVSTPRGEQSQAWAQTVCQDVLERRADGAGDEDGWLVRERSVHLDRLGPSLPPPGA
ncbi:nuclear transport factor 2 family protein [Streptomyces sp. I05A-00742]|uniref:nuclear transport factor 2 family protein n=1 Tax=Streptomyces sp. I05A-00742 TaxID=2732853 RepID=UPI001488F599|nr:nuclear transport factor 2 family protein [Streptomyces sp. I05A-00742]